MVPKMANSISKKRRKLPLLLQFPVNDHFVIGIYQGTISKFDMIIKYRQLINGNNLKAEVNKEAKNYEALANSGEYSVKFLLLLAKLLMFQEKTNTPNAYMFKKLLSQLKDCPCIFEIISTATHHR